MHRLVPELISANLQKGCLRGSYQATAMFLDVSGFSVMTDALMGQGRDGAEALAATMRGVLDPMVAAIHAHGGMVVGFAGDSITALFPSEPDRILAGLHALAAAGQIQESLRANPAFPTPYGAFRIAARAGLAEG